MYYINAFRILHSFYDRPKCLNQSDQCHHCFETFCRSSCCIDCGWLVFYLPPFLHRRFTGPVCLVVMMLLANDLGFRKLYLLSVVVQDICVLTFSCYPLKSLHKCIQLSKLLK